MTMFIINVVNLCAMCIAVLVLLLSVFQHASGQETCSVIGADREELNIIRFERFYLNLGDPAGCNGTVSSFTYCYYRPQIDASSYLSNFAVYRERSPGSQDYDRVSTVFVAERTRSEIEGQLGFDDGDFINSFDCVDHILNNSIAVETGDVLGACVFVPPGDIRELDIVGANRTSPSMLMRTDPDGCGLNSMPSNVSSLANSSNRVLHLHANIVPMPNTTPVDARIVVPIVVVVLIVVILVTSIMVVIVIVWARKLWQSERTYKKYDHDMEANKAYGVSSGVRQSEDVDHDYSTVANCEVNTNGNTEMRTIQGQTTAGVSTIELTPNIAYSTPITVQRNEANGTHKVTLDEPEVSMSSTEAYVVSGDGRQSENNEYYSTIPEQTDDHEYDYVP